MIIGLGHKKNMGKDTLAHNLAAALKFVGNYDFEVVSLSDRLFDAGEKFFWWAGMKGAAHYNRYYLEKNEPLQGLDATPRDVAKAIGNAVRSIEPDALIKAFTSDSRHRIITNVRFPNEAQNVRDCDWGGMLIRVDRPGVQIDHDDPFDTALDDWTDWDVIVNNDGDLGDLAKQCMPLARDIVEKMGGPYKKS